MHESISFKKLDKTRFQNKPCFKIIKIMNVNVYCVMFVID